VPLKGMKLIKNIKDIPREKVIGNTHHL